MTKIEGVKEWTDVILLEDGDVLHGGEDGLANVQAKALTDRTNWLKENMSMGGSGGNGTSGGGLPIGSIIAFGGTKVPFGYLECNGALLSRAAYIQLYETIGTTWGFTSESDFKIPNFTEAERFLRSRSESLPVGTLQGDAIRDIQGQLIAFPGPETSGSFAVEDSWLSVNGTGVNIRAARVSNKASRVVPTANENRPKSAVVMYCIKVLDSVIDPEQILAGSVVTEIANKASRNEVKELAGTRLWVSEEYQPVANTPTIVTHGLNLQNPERFNFDVLMLCKVADQGFNAGTILKDIRMYQSVGDDIPLQLQLSANSIAVYTAKELLVTTPMNGNNTINKSNWRYIFRIWY